MEECEALCGRLGIMVNGQIQCLGGVEHLKHKYAQGYSLMVKLRATFDAESAEAQELKDLVLQKFAGSRLKDKHQVRNCAFEQCMHGCLDSVQILNF